MIQMLSYLLLTLSMLSYAPLHALHQEAAAQTELASLHAALAALNAQVPAEELSPLQELKNAIIEEIMQFEVMLNEQADPTQINKQADIIRESITEFAEAYGDIKNDFQETLVTILSQAQAYCEEQEPKKIAATSAAEQKADAAPQEVKEEAQAAQSDLEPLDQDFKRIITALEQFKNTLNSFDVKIDPKKLITELRAIKSSITQFVSTYGNQSASKKIIDALNKDYEAIAQITQRTLQLQEQFPARLTAIENQLNTIQAALYPQPNTGWRFWQTPKTFTTQEIRKSHTAANTDIQKLLHDYGITLAGTRPAIVDDFLKRAQEFEQELLKRESIQQPLAEPVEGKRQ